MGNISPSINLLKKEEQGFLDKFIHWALTIGRFVVILTEGIALAAFLYRFTLDRQLVDLHDGIKQKQAIINVLKNNEITYRSLQERIGIASKLSIEGNTTVQVVNDIISLAPADMSIETLNVTNDRVRIEAKATSVGSLSQFTEKLRSYKEIQTVSLDKIENKTSNAIILVNITALLKKKGVTPL